MNGTVTAVLNPDTGMLQISEVAGDNQFTIAPAPTPGQIRVAGNPGTETSIISDTFADFSLDDVSDIQMTLRAGHDSVTLTDFSIPGAVTILYGNAADVFATPDFQASAINLVFLGSNGVLGSGQNNGLLPPPGGAYSGPIDGLLPPPAGFGNSGNQPVAPVGGADAAEGSGDTAGQSQPVADSGNTDDALPQVDDAGGVLGSGSNDGLVPPVAGFGSGHG